MLNNTLVAPDCDPSDPFAPRFWPSRLAELHQVKGWERGRTLTIARFEQKPRGIFLCDMGDLFGRCVPHEWTEQVMEAVKVCPQYRFYLLTKQPQELQKWSPFPENAWVGVSAWDHASFINACHYLAGIEATVKYISLEPLLDWRVGLEFGEFCRTNGISWLIIGAQTKPTIKVPGEWIDGIVSCVKSAGVAVFLKNSLRYLVEDEHFKFELLQEFPR
jgi:protein gp37